MPEPTHVRVSLTKPQLAAAIDAVNWHIPRVARLGTVERLLALQTVQSILETLLRTWPNG